MPERTAFSARTPFPRIFREQRTDATGMAPEFTSAANLSSGFLSPHPEDGMHDARLDPRDTARLDDVTGKTILPEIWFSVNWFAVW
jgi:hypothetical protein